MAWETTTAMVGGIWSRDKYIRFYSHEMPFSIQLIGNHMEQVDDNVWKLCEEHLDVDDRSTHNDPSETTNVEVQAS